MLLKDHPRVQWPPRWSTGNEDTAPEGEEGTLSAVELAGPTQLLLQSDFDGRSLFAELICPNPAFANKLFEAIESRAGRPIEEIGALEIT
jgi:hypothetical protein